MKKDKLFAFLTIVIFMAAFVSSSYAAHGMTVTASGKLMSVESDGAVLIDDQGHAVASSAVILDASNKKIELDNLKLPAKVEYRYVYTKKGPVIIYIRQIAE